MTSGSGELDIDRLEPEDAAMIIYTSGTTGPPKGAVLSHGNIVWMARTLGKIDDGVIVRESDEVLSFLPLCHIFERLFSVILHVMYGYTVSFVEGPDTVAENLAEVSPTIGYGVPRIWEKFHSRSRYAWRMRRGSSDWPIGRRFVRQARGAHWPGDSRISWCSAS